MESLLNSLLQLENPKQFFYSSNKEGIVGTREDFYEFYTQQRKTVDLNSESENYLSQISQLKKNSDNFNQKITNCIKILKELQDKNEFIAEKTRDLQSSTSKIIKEEEDLIELANELELKLSYFNSLEMVMKLLSSSGGDITQEKDFIPSLTLLDHCCQFLLNNLDYKESGVYLVKTKQCMTRSMMLIKMHIVDKIRKLAGDVRDLQRGTAQKISLLYTKFKKLGIEIKPLISELESRGVHNMEFQNLLKDSINMYFDTRRGLIGPIILENIQEMKQDSILDYTKTGCAYMIQICEDEFRLFHEFYELDHEELG